MTEQHSFIYRMDALKQEVEKRTSYLGRMRSAEGQAHLLERVALTDGEAFLSDEYLQEAAAETYDWIKAFGRGVEHAFEFFPDGNITAISEHFGAGIMQPNGLKTQQLCLPLTQGMYTIGQQHSAGGYIYSIPLTGYSIAVGTAKTVEYRITTRYTMAIPNTPFSEQRTQQTETTQSGNSQLVKYENTIPFESNGLGNVVPTSIDQIDIEIIGFVPALSIQRGEYVAYTDEAGITRYGVATEPTQYDGYSLPKCVWYDEDIRNAVVYTLAIPDWQEENTLRKVRNDLKEALVNFVIWRWFETVLPTEADTYYAKWEEKAHGAQLGLNTEKRVLQRRAVWL